MSELLQVKNLSKMYAGAPLLRAISFTVTAGEIVCLLGPSGTGKTTLLRIIAGLEAADSGQVWFAGRDLRGVPPHARGFGFMFQDLALFPHRNVFDNVAFGLRMQNAPPAEITARVNETLDLVGLDAAAFARRDVNHLSGGEQQRVALARTLAPRPRLVMFDEPLGALDRILREELVDELRSLLKRLNMTALYVTHDQDEAFAIGDRLVVLHASRIQQEGTPVQVYEHPANAFVARFMGMTNLIPIERLERRRELFVAETGSGAFAVPAEQTPAEPHYVLLRPRAVKRIENAGQADMNAVRGRVLEAQLRAGRQRLVVQTSANVLTLEWDDPVPLGKELTFELAEDEIAFLEE